MKRLTVQTMYAGIVLTILALIVVHAPLSVFFGSYFDNYSLLIKSWKEILMVIALVLMAVALTRAGKWHELFADKLLWLVIAYGVVHVGSLVMWNGANAALAGLAIDLRYVAYFVLVYVLVWQYPQYRKLFMKIAVAGAIVVIGFGTLQIILPPDSLKYLGYSDATIEPFLTIDRNSDFVRLQSTLRGPNPYGAYAASVAIVAAVWFFARSRRVDWRLISLGIAATIGTYLSYARSAYVALAAGLAIVLAVRFGRNVKLYQWLSLGVVMLAVIVGGFALRNNDFVSNVIMHEDPQEGGQINSNDGHWNSLVFGLRNLAEEPIGEGIGSTGSASLLSSSPQIIENQYFMIAHEVGWLGLAVFAAIFYSVMHRLWMQRSDPWVLGVFASGVCLALIGLLLPVWADDTVSIVWWGIAAALLAANANTDNISVEELHPKR